MIESYLDSYREAIDNKDIQWMEDIHQAIKNHVLGGCLCDARCKNECICGSWDE
jgi:hypothetical protein